MPQNQPDRFARYGSLAVQMGLIIGLSCWGGMKLDEKFDIKSSLFTIILSLLGLGAAFYVVFRDLTREK